MREQASGFSAFTAGGVCKDPSKHLSGPQFPTREGDFLTFFLYLGGHTQSYSGVTPRSTGGTIGDAWSAPTLAAKSHQGVL